MSSGDGPPAVKKYSLKEIAEHNSAKSTWIVIHDLIYDVTPFLDEHPGGEEILLEQAGKNGTENFEDVGHSTDAREMMKQYVIGEVIDEEKIDGKEPPAPDPSESSDSDSTWKSWLVPVAVALVISVAYRYFLVSNTSHRD